MKNLSILSFFYGFFDSKYKKNKKELNEIVLIEPTKLIISSELKIDNVLNLNWLFSKRLNLILTKNNLYLGENIIDKESASDAGITYFSSYFGLIKYQVLQFRYKNNLYLLGTSMKPNWMNFFNKVSEKKVDRKKNFYIAFTLIIAILSIIYSISKSLL